MFDVVATRSSSLYIILVVDKQLVCKLSNSIIDVVPVLFHGLLALIIWFVLHFGRAVFVTILLSDLLIVHSSFFGMLFGRVDLWSVNLITRLC